MARAPDRLSRNPTLTRGIEKAWIREANQRFTRFGRVIIDELFRIAETTLSPIVVNVGRFDIDQDQVRAFIAFYEQQLSLIIVTDWQSKYQVQAYQLAIERANQRLIADGFSTVITKRDRINAFASITPIVPIDRIHVEALEFLTTRSFNALKDFTVEMTDMTRSVLIKGLQKGKGVEDISKELIRIVGLGKNRAKLIARTETIAAYHEGTLNQTRLAEQFLDEEILVRWVTRDTFDVRKLHAGWHGDLITTDEAARRGRISPWNCRCGLFPVIEEANTQAKRDKFAAEQKQLLEFIEIDKRQKRQKRGRPIKSPLELRRQQKNKVKEIERDKLKGLGS